MTVKNFLKLYGLYFKMDLAWLLRDTLFAALAVLSDIVSNLAAVSGVFLVALRFGGIGSMKADEVLLMLSYAALLNGVFQMFFSGNNIGHISRRIGRGQVDHMFLMPLPLPVQLLTEGFMPVSGSGNFFTGLVLMVLAVKKLRLSPPVWWIASVGLNITVSLLILLALSYLCASAAFYYPAAAEEISSYVLDSVNQLSSFPLSGMPFRLQLPLITVVPAGLVAWFPTLSLLGKPPLGLPAYFPFVIAVIITVAATIMFQKGLRYYVQKGANRYSAGGHRR